MAFNYLFRLFIKNQVLLQFLETEKFVILKQIRNGCVYGVYQNDGLFSVFLIEVSLIFYSCKCLFFAILDQFRTKIERNF